MAAGEGFEPSHTESESAVLPLHNPAKRKVYYTDIFSFVKGAETLFCAGKEKNMTNVEEFFQRYDAEPALQQKVADALAWYPGSLELRESVVENVLLPVAAEEGLPFTLQELRAYETRKKLQNMKPDVAIEEGEPVEEPVTYWLLDTGWEWDVTEVRKRENLLRDIAGWRKD